MLSAFNTKFKALKNRLPQSSLDSPWRMALFWMVATVVILASFLLMIIGEVFKAMAHTDDGSDDAPAKDDRDKEGLYYSKNGYMGYLNLYTAEAMDKADRANDDDW
jgi:hypothetical protein